MADKIKTTPYKGVRDFYPQDMRVHKYILGKMREAVERFGYEEYDASILEPSEMYESKSSQEIVSEQTYTFEDRGGRSVTLRPEMTPTVARMVAGKKRELTMPVRWYSIPNLFRYEKPQKGRMREHYQLNVDLLGASGVVADREIISIAYGVMKAFGASDDQFEIRLNNRALINDLFKKLNISEKNSQLLFRVLDKKDKISGAAFSNAVTELIGDKADEVIQLLNNKEAIFEIVGEDNDNAQNLIQIIDGLSKLGIENVVFKPTLTRGFDYYTGMVFEIFDTSPDNKRSLFGGGRYDDLLSAFGTEKTPSVGFGMGDITAQDFLETHDLIPDLSNGSGVYVGVIENKSIPHAEKLAYQLRESDVNTVLDLSSGKVGKQISIAEKKGLPCVLFIGEKEVADEIYTVKHLESGIEKHGSIKDIPQIIKDLTNK